MDMGIVEELAGLDADMTAWRHHLHAFPETAFEERQTADFLAEKLESFGLEVHRGIGRTGIVAQLVRGGEPTGAIGLRADMDALDIQEENDLEYKSTVPGKMHACGHDGHMAMLLGSARHLASRGRFSGTVTFIFQPAEETARGAKAMVEDGLFRRFSVDRVFGLHNIPGMPEGTFAASPGAMLAAFDTFDITISGVGGHAGGLPGSLRDPVVAASEAVVMFQSIVSRNVGPAEAAVVSVTEMKGGAAYNVIPDKVALRGCTRHFKPHIQDLVERRMTEILRGLEVSLGVAAEMRYERRCPALINSPKETEEALRAAVLVVGSDRVYGSTPPVMASEDFSVMLNSVPGAYLALGAGPPQPNGMTHQPAYDFNDRLLSLGARYWVSLVESLLPVR